MLWRLLSTSILYWWCDVWRHARQYVQLRTHHSNARAVCACIMLWSGHVLLKTTTTGPVVMSHDRVAFNVILIYQSLAFVVDKHLSHILYSLTLTPDSDVAVPFAKRSAKLRAASGNAHSGSRAYKHKQVCGCAYMVRREMECRISFKMCYINGVNAIIILFWAISNENAMIVLRGIFMEEWKTIRIGA